MMGMGLLRLNKVLARHKWYRKEAEIVSPDGTTMQRGDAEEPRGKQSKTARLPR